MPTQTPNAKLVDPNHFGSVDTIEALRQAQPFYSTMEESSRFFKQRTGMDPFDESGYQAVVSNDANRHQYIDKLLELVGEENAKRLLGKIIDRNIKEENNLVSRTQFLSDISQEGFGDMSVSGGYSSLTHLTPSLIVGYTAKAYAMEWYHLMENDKPEWTYTYPLDSVYKGDNYDDKKSLSEGIRDGSVADMLELPEIVPTYTGNKTAFSDNGEAAGANTNIVSIGTIDGKLEEGFIKVGSKGNLLEEAGKKKYKSAIEDGIVIDEILYWSPDDAGELPADGPTAASGTTRVVSYLVNEHTGSGVKNPSLKRQKVYIDREVGTGDTSVVNFQADLKLTVGTGANQKTIEENFFVQIDLDMGDYKSSKSNDTRIVAFKFHAEETNVANEQDTISTDRKTYIHNFKVKHRTRLAIALSPEASEDYNVSGPGVSLASVLINNLSTAYAGLQNNDLENVIIKGFGRNVNTYRLYPKLRGYKSEQTYPLSQSGQYVDDPGERMKKGLKDMFMYLAQASETDTSFKAGTSRQWITMASSLDAFRVPDLNFVNDVSGGEVSAAPGETVMRYGFTLDAQYGFTDSFGRRMKVIGINDSRWNNRPMYAFQRSNDISQPTAIYWPYTFRVFSGIKPEIRNQPAICVYARDLKEILSFSGFKITLTGNTADLYSQMNSK